MTLRLIPEHFPFLAFRDEVTWRRSFTPTALHWMVGGGFVMVDDGRVRWWA